MSHTCDVVMLAWHKTNTHKTVTFITVAPQPSLSLETAHVAYAMHVLLTQQALGKEPVLIADISQIFYNF
jgi:hypothetical protein